MSIQLPSTPGRATFRKLGIALLVLALVAGAGCSGAVLGGSDDGDSGSSGEPIEYVPADQNIVMEFDMAIAEDQTTQRLMEESEDEEETQQEQAEFQQSLAQLEAVTGLDPSGFNSLLIYGESDQATTSVEQASSEDDVGIVVDTDWSLEELRNASESLQSLESTTSTDDGGSTTLVEQDYTESGVFYEIQSETDDSEDETYLGVHGDGVYVIGTEDPVRNSLDITYDGGDALDGELRDAYDSTRDGYVTFAMTLPEDTGSGTSAGMGASMGDSIGAMTGVYYTDGNSIGVEGRIRTESSQTASLFQTTISQQIDPLRQDPEYAEALQYLEVTTDGSDVVMTYESDIETLIEASESND